MYYRLFLVSLALTAAQAAPPAAIDASKAVVVLPFEQSVKGTPGFIDAARNAVVAYLKDDALFSAVMGPDEAKDKDKGKLLEITGTLVEFKGGNMATRALVGFGAGRASAALDFTVKDVQTGSVLWRKQIKEKASVWSNASSSNSQRGELPDKLAQTLLKELKKNIAK